MPCMGHSLFNDSLISESGMDETESDTGRRTSAFAASSVSFPIPPGGVAGRGERSLEHMAALSIL